MIVLCGKKLILSRVPTMHGLLFVNKLWSTDIFGCWKHWSNFYAINCRYWAWALIPFNDGSERRKKQGYERVVSGVVERKGGGNREMVKGVLKKEETNSNWREGWLGMQGLELGRLYCQSKWVYHSPRMNKKPWIVLM